MLQIGLIGAGRWGQVYMRTIEELAPRLKLARVATSKPENSWKELVRSPEIDAVVIATPAPLHAEMLRACLEAGKPAIAEKPLCFDSATARSLKELADKTKLPVLVNYIHLYNPAYSALKKAVAVSGQPVRAVLTEGMDLGPFRADTSALWDRAPHDVAICLDLMSGAGPVSSFSAAGAFPDRQGRPEMVSLQLEWKNGAGAWIQSGRLSPQKKRTVSVLTDNAMFHFDDQAEVKCRRIPIDYTGRSGLGSTPLSKEGEPIPVPEKRAPMELMLSAFADQVEKRAPPAGLEFTVELTRLLEECDKLLSK